MCGEERSCSLCNTWSKRLRLTEKIKGFGGCIFSIENTSLHSGCRRSYIVYVTCIGNAIRHGEKSCRRWPRRRCTTERVNIIAVVYLVSGIWRPSIIHYRSYYTFSSTHAARSRYIHCRRSRQPVDRVLRVWPNGLTVSDGSGAHRTWLHIIILLIILCAAYIYYTHVGSTQKRSRSRPRRLWARAFLFSPLHYTPYTTTLRYYVILLCTHRFTYIRVEI